MIEMTYEEQIIQFLNSHIQNLMISKESSDFPKKVDRHIDRTNKIHSIIKNQRPEDYRQLIEYLHSESRKIGWSYPENIIEENCEDSFRQLWNSMKNLIVGMTGNERLYFFGYIKDYDKLSLNLKSARNEIRLKLFMD